MNFSCHFCFVCCVALLVSKKSCNEFCKNLVSGIEKMDKNNQNSLFEELNEDAGSSNDDFENQRKHRFDFIEQFSLSPKLRRMNDKSLKISEILQNMPLLKREKPPQEQTEEAGRDDKRTGPSVEEIHLRKVLKRVAEGQEKLMATVAELDPANGSVGVSPKSSMNRVAAEQRSLMKSVADLQHAYKNFTNPQPTVPEGIVPDSLNLPEHLRIPWNAESPAASPSFLDEYMAKMESNIEKLKLKMDEFDRQKESYKEKSSKKKPAGKEYHESHEKEPAGKQKSSESDRSRSRSRGRKKDKRKRRTIYIDKSCSSGRSSDRGGSSKQRKKSTRKHRKNRSRDRESCSHSKKKTSRRKTSRCSSDGGYVIKRQGGKEKSKDDYLEDVINQLLKKSRSCSEHLEKGGKLRVLLEGYPPIMLNGEECSDDGASSAKTYDGLNLC